MNWFWRVSKATLIFFAIEIAKCFKSQSRRRESFPQPVCISCIHICRVISNLPSDRSARSANPSQYESENPDYPSCGYSGGGTDAPNKNTTVRPVQIRKTGSRPTGRSNVIFNSRLIRPVKVTHATLQAEGCRLRLQAQHALNRFMLQELGIPFNGTYSWDLLVVAERPNANMFTYMLKRCANMQFFFLLRNKYSTTQYLSKQRSIDSQKLRLHLRSMASSTSGIQRNKNK